MWELPAMCSHVLLTWGVSVDCWWRNSMIVCGMFPHMFICTAVICPSPDGMGNGGQSGSDALSICSLHREHLIGHPDSSCLLLIVSSLAANQLYHLGSGLGQDITDHLNPPTVTYTVWAGTDNGFVYKYSVETQPPPHWPLMVETDCLWAVRHQLHIGWLTAQNDFIVYCCQERLK
jgi:hypothetical protein